MIMIELASVFFNAQNLLPNKKKKVTECA